MQVASGIAVVVCLTAGGCGSESASQQNLAECVPGVWLGGQSPCATACYADASLCAAKDCVGANFEALLDGGVLREGRVNFSPERRELQVAGHVLTGSWAVLSDSRLEFHRAPTETTPLDPVECSATELRVLKGSYWTRASSELAKAVTATLESKQRTTF